MRIVLCIAALIVFSSCKNTWDSESRDLFVQGCLNDAKEQGMPDDKAKSMCNCRLEKVMKKYPKMEDALEHIGDISNDPEIQACK